MTNSSSSVFESSTNYTQLVQPGNIEKTVFSHHEVLIRLDERQKTFATKDDLSKFESQISTKISKECEVTRTECHDLIKWCIGTVVAAIISIIIGLYSVSKNETSIKLFVVKDPEFPNSIGVQATEIPREQVVLPKQN